MTTTKTWRPRIGDKVRIERDEQLYPSRGSWPRYRGRVGTLVARNQMDGEWGVKFTNAHDEPTAWFLLREMVPAYSRKVTKVTA